MREGRIPPEGKERLVFLLQRCGRKIFYHSEPGMRQTSVLRMLLDGPVTQKQMQERLGTSAASVSELVSKLEMKNCLVRQRSEGDRRSVLLMLTEKGEKIARHSVPETPASELFEALTEQERAELERLLEKLLRSDDDTRGERP